MSASTDFTDRTARWGLPLLYVGQAQKETTVNEAATLADLLLHPVIGSVQSDPPAAPQPGEAWIVGDAATGEWAGREGCLAGWTDGGWRFASPRAGLRVYDASVGAFRTYADAWTLPASPALPSGGANPDLEARAAIASLVEALRNAGLFSAT